MHRDRENLGLYLIAFLIVCRGISGFVQFLALLCHRVQTFILFLSCTPWTGNNGEKERKMKGNMTKVILVAGQIGKRVSYPTLDFLVVNYFNKID